VKINKNRIVLWLLTLVIIIAGFIVFKDVDVLSREISQLDKIIEQKNISIDTLSKRIDDKQKELDNLKMDFEKNKKELEVVKGDLQNVVKKLEELTAKAPKPQK